MEIEQKERERIEADIDAYIKDLWHDVHSPNNNSPKIVEAITHFRAGKQSEHLHLQKEVIQPLRKELKSAKDYIASVETSYGKCGSELIDSKERVSKLEAEVKALREALTEIERVCDNNNPTHADIWRRAYQELNKK